MSPHALIFLAAMLLGAATKMIVPRFTLRIVGLCAVAVPLSLAVHLGEPPSVLGLAIVAPIGVAGSAAGVAAGALAMRGWRRLRG
jgi:membrane protein implicated in regulation of membrane protease activity